MNININASRGFLTADDQSNPRFLTKKGTLSELAWPPDGKVILCYVDTQFSMDKKTI